MEHRRARSDQAAAQRRADGRGCARNTAQGGLLHYGQGKWYPGEQLPRWSLNLFWRKDGEPIWTDPALLRRRARRPRRDRGDRAASSCSASPSGSGSIATTSSPAYEDAWYYLWRERKLPANVDPVRRAARRPAGARAAARACSSRASTRRSAMRCRRARRAPAAALALAAPGSCATSAATWCRAIRRWATGCRSIRSRGSRRRPAVDACARSDQALPPLPPRDADPPRRATLACDAPSRATACSASIRRRAARTTSSAGDRRRGAAEIATTAAQPDAAAGVAAATRRARRCSRSNRPASSPAPRSAPSRATAGSTSSCRRLASLEDYLELVAAVEDTAASDAAAGDPRRLRAAARPAPLGAARHARPRRDRGQHPSGVELGRAGRPDHPPLRGGARDAPGDREVHARRPPHRHRRRQPLRARRRDAGRLAVPAPARSARQHDRATGTTIRRCATCSRACSSARPARRRASTRRATTRSTRSRSRSPSCAGSPRQAGKRRRG